MWVILGFWAIIIEKSVCRENYDSYTDYIARQTIHFKRQHVLEVTTTKTTVSFRGRKTIYFALQESHTWIEFLLFLLLAIKEYIGRTCMKTKAFTHSLTSHNFCINECMLYETNY